MFPWDGLGLGHTSVYSTPEDGVEEGHQFYKIASGESRMTRIFPEGQ